MTDVDDSRQSTWPNDLPAEARDWHLVNTEWLLIACWEGMSVEQEDLEDGGTIQRLGFHSHRAPMKTPPPAEQVSIKRSVL